MPQLSQTVFATQPDKELLVEDAYGKKDNSVVNEESQMTDAEWKAAYDEANPEEVAPPPPLKALTSETIESQTIPTVEVDNMADAVKSQGTAVRNAINSLPDTIKTAVTATKQAMNTVSQVVNGVQQAIKGAPMAVLNSVGGAINNMTNGAVSLTFQDKLSVGKLGANLVVQAEALGVKGAFSMFTQGQVDTQVLKTMVKELAPVAVVTGSLGLLSDLSKSPLVSEIKAAVPNVVSEFAQNYVAPLGQTATQKIQEGKEMFETFDRVDPGWSTGVGGVTKVDALANASPNARGVFESLAKDSNMTLANSTPADVVGTVPARTEHQKIAVAAVASTNMSESMGKPNVPVSDFGTTTSSEHVFAPHPGMSKVLPGEVPINKSTTKYNVNGQWV